MTFAAKMLSRLRPTLRSRIAELEATVEKVDLLRRDLSVRLVRQTQVTAQLRSERMEAERRLSEMSSLPAQKEMLEHWMSAACETYREMAHHELKSNEDFQRRLVEHSGLFDQDYYVGRYPHSASNGVSPLSHFITIGGQEGRAPSPRFDSARYLADNEDVAKAGLNPLIHYLLYGFAEGRRFHGAEPTSKSVALEEG